ncbi:ribonucleoside-diphosphate reductase, adenosylcobalamin-dependent [Candidatus Pacearchaeota archaeon]|nr:ribonucleoside-diphosphate reductase, adenosylcobalamin-dependent [Candidatus Pacearchaeota archaeon]
MVETKSGIKKNWTPPSNGLESKIYSVSRDEALKSSIEYFKGDKLAADAFLNKYALKDHLGNIYESSPDQMHKRLSKEISRIESKYSNPMDEEKIYSLLNNFKYIIPQGSPMSGIGNNFQKVSLSNCFVIGNDGPSDSYGAIMKTDQEQVQLMKRRGGVGHDLSHIRPGGSPVENSALTSTGIVPFMERYSNSTREVAQDGRRGALMLSISIKHPDSEKFIDAKMKEGKVTGANVSVKIDDEFMTAIKKGKKYIQQYSINSEEPAYKKEIDAQGLWKKIIHNAWKSAEPGILFWDTIIKESVPDCYADKGYKTISTNPCGEIPLCPYDSCRLLAINLYSYVDEPFTKNSKFNKELFREHTGYAQRMMDDIIDLELEKIDDILEKVENDPEDEEIKRVEYNLWEKIQQKAKEGRRTGIGITGEMALGVYRASVETAKERGAFEIYDFEKEKNNPFIQRLFNEDKKLEKDMKKYGRRNIALLTVAPTGTVSLMAQTSSGLEPAFQVAYTRRRKVNPNDKDVKVAFVDGVGDSWEEYKVFHHKFEKWLEINGHNIDDVKKYDNGKLDEIVKKSPYYQATANDVDWIKKVELQGAVQKWVDHSISVTINLPKDASEKLVGDLYMKAWEVGCKGVTVYRDGSRSGVLLTGKEKSENNENEKTLIEKINKLERKEKLELLKYLVKERMDEKRPEIINADLMRFKNGDENWLAFVGLNEIGYPYEIFTGKTDEEILAVPKSIKKGKIVKVKDNGKSRYDFKYKDRNGYEDNNIAGISHQFNRNYWNNARWVSSELRNGVKILEIIKTVRKLDEGEEGINSWKNGVVRVLEKYLEDGTKTGEMCEKCNGSTYVYEEGCRHCKNCGHSKCG